MTDRQAPALTTWLLKRLASGSRRESLIGDLTEQYQHERSATWYWRQVLTAILVGAAHDIRDHKVLAVRGVIIGLVCGWLLLFISSPIPRLDDWLFVTGVADVRSWWPKQFLALAVSSLCGLSAGWLVRRWHPISIVVAYSASVLILSALGFWLVALPYARGPKRFEELVMQATITMVLLPITILLGGAATSAGRTT